MEPKACPFCGGEPRVCPDTSYGDATVFCPDGNDCPVSPIADASLRDGETVDDAITRWNTRAPSTAIGEPVGGVVNQADRERAADYMRDAGWTVDVNWVRETDTPIPLIQAFARHRLAALAEGRAWCFDMDCAPAGIANLVIVAVPGRDGTAIVGEAYLGGDDREWWWANTNAGDYTASPIPEIQHGSPFAWMPMPEPPPLPTAPKDS
jgi:hypothetical protein